MEKSKAAVSGLGAAVVGAAVGVTAAVLADKRNRKFIKKTVSDVMDEGEKRISQARKYIESVGVKGANGSAGKAIAAKGKKKRVTKLAK